MSNRFWTDKTDGVDDIVAEDFNSAFDSIAADMDKKSDILTFDTTPTADSTNPVTSGGVKAELDKKADKQTANGGFAGGNNASATYGGAIGYNAKALEGGAVGNNAGAASGGAIGDYAKARTGGAVGSGARATFGGAVGQSAEAGEGFAGGRFAKTKNSDNTVIDAIQLGTGTNSEEKTAQFYDYKMMKADGNIPVERLTELKKLSIPHTTASGYPVSVSDHLEGESLINYKVYGNSVQDGTPAPDTPIEIQSVGDLVTDTSSPYYGKYDVSIEVSSKNKIPYPYYNTTKTVNGITFTDNRDGTITVNGTATANTTFAITSDKWDYSIPLSAGTYTLSGCPSGGGNTTYRINLGGRTSEEASRVMYARDDGESKTVKLNYGRYDFSITIYNNITVSNLIFKPQLELGTISTPYEPYKGETKHIYLDEPLRKVGNYADYVDWGNQKVVRNAYASKLSDFAYSVKNESTNSKFFRTGYFAPPTTIAMRIGRALLGYCNVLPSNIGENGWDCPTQESLRFGQGNNVIYVYTANTYSSKEELLNYLGNDAYVIYPLAKPTTEPITVPDFDVPNSEVMNVSSSTVIPPSSMDVTYYQDINKVITELKNAILAQGGNV